MKIKHQIFLTRNGLEIEGKMITTSPRFLWKIDLISIFPTPPRIMLSEERVQMLSRLQFFLWGHLFQNLASVKWHRKQLIMAHPVQPHSLYFFKTKAQLCEKPDHYAHNKTFCFNCLIYRVGIKYKGLCQHVLVNLTLSRMQCLFYYTAAKNIVTSIYDNLWST